MKRYQVSLDSQSFAVLDNLEKVLKISKVEIIQKAIDQFGTKFINVFAMKKTKTKKQTYKHFDKLIGFIDLKTDKKTNFAHHVDDIYNSH